MSRVTQVGGYGRKGIKRGRQADRKETEGEESQIQSAGAREPRRWPIGRQDLPAAGPSAASAVVSAAARSPLGTLGSDAPSAARNANSVLRFGLSSVGKGDTTFRRVVAKHVVMTVSGGNGGPVIKIVL